MAELKGIWSFIWIELETNDKTNLEAVETDVREANKVWLVSC